jgi:hypothetical protein
MSLLLSFISSSFSLSFLPSVSFFLRFFVLLSFFIHKGRDIFLLDEHTIVSSSRRTLLHGDSYWTVSYLSLSSLSCFFISLLASLFLIFSLPLFLLIFFLHFIPSVSLPASVSLSVLNCSTTYFFKTHVRNFIYFYNTFSQYMLLKVCTTSVVLDTER